MPNQPPKGLRRKNRRDLTERNLGPIKKLAAEVEEVRKDLERLKRTVREHEKRLTPPQRQTFYTDRELVAIRKKERSGA